MLNFRVVLVELATCVSAAMIALPAGAQTATPTLTPVPTPTCTPRNAAAACLGAKLQVTWLSKDPSTARIAASATGCPSVPSCAQGVDDGDLVSIAPVAVTITDKNNNSLTKQITDPGRNTGGCPGGSDTYRGADRLRLVYGAATTLIAKFRIPLAQPGAPTLSPPITVAVRDACGSLINARVNTCIPKPSTTGMSLKCF